MVSGYIKVNFSSTQAYSYENNEFSIIEVVRQTTVAACQSGEGSLSLSGWLI